MRLIDIKRQPGRRTFAQPLVLFSLAALSTGSALGQQFQPGNLVVSRSVYSGNPRTIAVGTILPPGCTGTTAGCAPGSGAIANGAYPYVFNNDTYDSSFGVTSPIFLDQITLKGDLINTLEVPNSLQPGITPTSDQLVTSFPSKSELALHLSLNKRYLTFVGYVAPVNSIDVSNSNTAAAPDPTNPVGLSYYRAVAVVDKNGAMGFTETNAYSGNNGRAAIMDAGNAIIYTAGNAGNGANPQPDHVVLGAGAQFIRRSNFTEYGQNPQVPAPVGSFSVTELGAKADKIGKDDNFRGMTIFNNVLYYTKGSGGNGVNTVYFVDTTGSACPNGVGVPAPGVKLPAAPLAYDSAKLQKSGLPSNMCILRGFPATPNKSATVTAYPFGLWFADANTLYVADEGDGYTGGTDLYTHAAAQTMAGLQKWVFNAGTQTWNLAYTLQAGLDLGKPYGTSAYPTGDNPVTGLPWKPATDGLRNITGMVGDGVALPVGYAAIYAVSSTVSGNGDVGADPNKLYRVIDKLDNTNPAIATHEGYVTIRYTTHNEVLRGVSFTPGTANITSY